MKNERLLAQLFVRESHIQQLISQDKVGLDVLEMSEFKAWLGGKRAILVSDVADTHWIKTCTGGYITEVVFHSDGTLNEYRLFDRFETKGIWSLQHGALSVEIFKGDNTYSFGVVGNSELNIHSAVEHKNGELHSYLKLSQVK
ncbi:hypothetical protein OH458_21650 [Vibrio sp. MarTm2]|uniref:hypothetical protein n=1 Tax=Vibrio sp. MarTm2 TaxID=2998831 RepID=UPI0022CD50FC|nr:hypothetical protein [Vibrio sp. MarTm2]MDA0130672.1 hypothetical protein [Vibrio sp. MarTm2]